MKKGKTPGPDRFSLEFYLTFYQDIKHLLLDALNFAYSQTDHDPTQYRGIITLYFKNGKPADIKNYRPISLLNVDYKILNKILNERLKNFLNHLISPLQHAQPGKSTHTVSITLRDIYDMAQHNTADSYFISIDFRKSFDTIEYKWLNSVLQYQNFSAHLL